MIAAIVTIVLCSFINAMRGGRFAIVNRLPGHTRLWATLAFFLVAFAFTFSVKQAALWAGCYLFWAFLPWGRWFDLNHSETLPDRPPSIFEKAIEKISGPNDQIAFALRNLIALLPTATFISPFAILLVATQQAAYICGWFFAPRRAIELAEYLTGIGWGLALVLL